MNKVKIISLTITMLSLYDISAQSKEIIICGKILSTSNISVQVYTPINNYYNISLLKQSYKDSIFEKDSFYFKEKISYGSSIRINCSNFEDRKFVGASVFLGCPGDSIHVTINPEVKTSEWVWYSGSNSYGNNLFQKLNYSLAEKYKPIEDLLFHYSNQNFDFVNNYSKIIDSIMTPFQELLNDNRITFQYYRLIRKTYSILYIDQVIGKFIFPPKQILKIPKITRIKLIDSLLYLQPGTDLEVKPLFQSPLFLESYYSFLQFKKGDFQSAQELNKKDSLLDFNGKKEIINENIVHLIDIKDINDKEALWAFFMADFIPSLFKLESIEQYQRLFPGSIFTNYLYIKWKSKGRIENPEYVLQSPIIIADSSGQIRSFKQILELPELKSSNILVDLWASWCGPCIEEFPFNKNLDSFLISNEIMKVYISLDGLNNSMRWNNAIEKYKLGGIHFLAGDSLAFDIKRSLGIQENSITIPRYILIDRENKKFVNIVLRPSDGKEFYGKIIDTFQLNKKNPNKLE